MLRLKITHTIDLLLLTYHSDCVMYESEHFKRDNFFPVQLPDDGKRFGKLQIVHTIASSTKELLKKRKYDFVYGLGEGTIIGVMEARRADIPCGYRQFGIYNEFERGVRSKKTILGKRLESFLHHTYAYIPMRARMDFLLNTNDGSHQDLLFDMMKIKKSD